MPSGITPKTTSMPSFSKNDLLLVRYPFSDLSATKVRPAVVVSAPHVSSDLFIVPLTSRLTSLLPGEFVLKDASAAGLNAPGAVKRGLATVHPTLVVKRLGSLSKTDAAQLEKSLRDWLGLPPIDTAAL